MLLILVSIASCSQTKIVTQTNDTQNLIFNPETRAKVKGQSNIDLAYHQLVPIDYLHQNPDLKGILVNHYMGTGKTFLGVGFAQSFPDHPVVILAPKFLESHWKNQLVAYGVTNPKRFMFVSYEDAPEKLSNLDLTNYLILADEVHNLIKKMRSPNQEQNARYTKVYSNLRTAYKIIGLSGTPIYGNESDVAFILNLVSGKNLMPFNQEEFRLEYTQIITTRQFFRGYLTESNLFTAVAPTVLGAFFSAIIGPFGLFIGMPIGIFGPLLVNTFVDPKFYKFRKFDVDKMQPILNRYVSYFKFDESHFDDFPAQKFSVETVPYNRKQYSFFLRLVEGDLPVSELQRLLRNEESQKSDEYVEINSTAIHENIYSNVGAGRDIGNFEFAGQDGKIIEAPKFLKIYQDLITNNEQTIIYSNYYHTGILAFADFLKRQGYKQNYDIISPDLTVDQVTQIVNKYNNQETRLLLLHPDVTEGISLKGTQFMHFLEPMMNSTVLEQVIGRARRFQSHSHLPKEKQLVTVKMWQSTSSLWDSDLTEIKRANWYKRYRELAYMARWTLGVWQIDKNDSKKLLNPEELALLHLATLKSNLEDIENLLKTQSIEKFYANGAPDGRVKI